MERLSSEGYDEDFARHCDDERFAAVSDFEDWADRAEDMGTLRLIVRSPLRDQVMRRGLFGLDSRLWGGSPPPTVRRPIGAQICGSMLKQQLGCAPPGRGWRLRAWIAVSGQRLGEVRRRLGPPLARRGLDMSDASAAVAGMLMQRGETRRRPPRRSVPAAPPPPAVWRRMVHRPGCIVLSWS